MTIKVEIDALEVLEHLEAKFAEEGARAITYQLAEAARDKWIRLAEKELRSTRQAYIAGISPVEEDEGVAFIELLGWLPNRVEQGLDPYDLRDTLLNQKARVTKDGRKYRVIPFRFTGPGSGYTLGQPMGKALGGGPERSRSTLAAAPAAEAYGKAVYQAAKKLKKGQSLPSGLTPKLHSRHSTDLTAGMRRERRNGGGSQYQTYRTIAEGQSPSKWLHPGIEARGFAPKVAQHVGKIAEGAVRAYVMQVLKP